MASITDLLDRSSDSTSGRPVVTTLAGPKAVAAASLSIDDATNWTTTSAIHFIIYKTNANGTKDPATQTEWKGVLSGTTVSNLTLTGGTDQAYVTGDVVELAPTARYAKDLYDWGITHADQDGTLKAGAVDNAAVLASNVVTTAKILDANVTTAKIANANVTKAKLETPHYATISFNSYGSSGGQVVATTTATLSFSTTLENNGLTIGSGTITIARDGLYKMSCCILMDNGGVGAASLRIRLNGADAAVNSMPDMQANRGVSVETSAYLTAGTIVSAAVATSANQRFAAAGASTQRTCSLSVTEIR